MGDERRASETEPEATVDRCVDPESAFDRVYDAVYTLDAELQYTSVNDRVRALLERSAGDETDGATEPDRADGSASLESVIEGLESLFRETHESALERQHPVTAVDRHEPTGRWLEARCYPDESGVTVVVSDVTERKRRKRRLEEENRRLRSIFEDAHDAILVADDDEISAANPAASELIGLERSELRGRSLAEFIHDDHDLESAWEEFLERGRLRGSFSLVRPDGTERVVEYNSVADVLPGVHLSILRDVTDARQRERQLEHHRERLAALDHVNGVVREINDAIVNGSTRDHLERATCESLADSPSYEFAFIADVDTKTNTVSHRVEAGVDGYVESIPLSIDSDDSAGRGPAGTAIRTETIQVSNDVLEDPSFEPWHEDAREHGYRSAAAIPITHDSVLYGVLGVTSARRNAFTDEERDVVGQLGEILGHAIAALERKRVLLGDDVIELELVIDDAVEMFDAPSMTGHSVWFDRVIRIDDERYLEYGTTDAETLPLVEELVECVPHWNEVTVIDRSAGDVTFELSITDPPMFGVVDAYGGYVEAAAIHDGEYTTTVHFPTGTDIRAVVDEIVDVYSGTRTVARRQISTSSESIDRLQNRLAEALTDRQRTALETAYYGGYFEWPRHSSGEEVAAAMEVTPATFHEHLRAAQKKLVGAILDEPDGTT
ncbi:bacterio-opsin activator domain-containing protein [Natronorubrum halophilum]|uniref:bacterio-opsin activator domain-containing protein n=1 Tax=Natronorubrum halophilum TaxID=1702106 RepID=UPI000EF6F39D|nr:bacterio-opsin activator domain-containing protein [Natronorubrum halophilum]